MSTILIPFNAHKEKLKLLFMAASNAFIGLANFKKDFNVCDIELISFEPSNSVVCIYVRPGHNIHAYMNSSVVVCEDYYHRYVDNEEVLVDPLDKSKCYGREGRKFIAMAKVFKHLANNYDDEIASIGFYGENAFIESGSGIKCICKPQKDAVIFEETVIN